MKLSYEKIIRSSDPGMTLVGILASLAVGIVVTLAVSKIIIDTRAGQRYVEFKTLANNFRYEILGFLSNQAACTASFANVDLDTGLPAKTTLVEGGTVGYSVFVAGGPLYQQGRIRLSRMFFKTGVESDFNLTNAVDRKGYVGLMIQITNNDRLSLGVSDIFEMVKLAVEVDAGNAITSCVAAGNDESVLWRLNGARAFYLRQNAVSSRVGIGNSNPVYNLDVTGDIRVRGPAGSIFASFARSPIFTTSGNVIADTFRATRFEYTSDKNLKTGIKTLDKEEDVKKLTGFSFNWKKSGRSSMGLIAQEVEKVFPFTVSENEFGYRMIEYNQILAPLLEQTKKISSRAEAIRNKMKSLATTQSSDSM